MPTDRSRPLDRRDEGASADEDTTRPSRWWLVAVVAAGTAAVLALALAVVVSGHLREDLPRAAPGEIIAAPFQGDLPNTTATIALPWRQMSLTVDAPTDELPDALRDVALVAPPEDGSFVLVDLRPADTKNGPAPFISQGAASRTKAEVTLTADGKEYPLDGPDGLGVSPQAPQPSGAFARWVAVEGHPTDVAVTITVDGQQQTVDTDGTVKRGKAAELRDLPPATELAQEKPSSCGTPDQSGSSTAKIAHSDLPECQLAGSLRTPFVDGLGWAGKGKEYLVVQATADEFVDLPDEDDAARSTSTRVEARLGRTQPEPGSDGVDGSALGMTGGSNSHQFVFEVPAGKTTEDLTLSLDAKATPSDPFASAAPERVRFTWTVSGQELT